MRGKRNEEVVAICRRMRKQDLSLRQIHELTGVSKSSLSTWVRDLPSLKDRQAERMREAAEARKKKRKVELGRWAQKVDATAMSRKQKGQLAEAAVLFRLLLHGFDVYGSPFDGDTVDWVANHPNDGKLLRVQVKWAVAQRQGRPLVKLTRYNTAQNTIRYKDGEFDFIVGYTFQNDTCYVWSADDVKSNKAVVAVHDSAEEAWHKLRSN